MLSRRRRVARQHGAIGLSDWPGFSAGKSHKVWKKIGGFFAVATPFDGLLNMMKSLLRAAGPENFQRIDITDEAKPRAAMPMSETI